MRPVLAAILTVLSAPVSAAGGAAPFGDGATPFPGDDWVLRERWIPPQFSETTRELLRQPPSQRAAEEGDAPVTREAARGTGGQGLSVPLFHRRYAESLDGRRRFDALGLEWQQALAPNRTLALGARLGETDFDGHRNLVNSEAAVGLSTVFPTLLQPKLRGTVFLGGDSTRDDSLRYLGRRYYGLTLGGRFSVFQGHTPYVSLTMQWSDYNGGDSAPHVQRDEASRLAVGWDWRVSGNFGLRAQANYIINSPALDPFGLYQGRSQYFLGTRYRFR